MTIFFGVVAILFVALVIAATARSDRHSPGDGGWWAGHSGGDGSHHRHHHHGHGHDTDGGGVDGGDGD